MVIVKLAKEGQSPSQIGLHLRDTYGIPSVRAAIGRKVSKVLAEKSLLKEQIEKEMKNYTFYGRKKTILIPVVADERLPDIFVGKFKRENMKRGMEIGYGAMEQALKSFHQKK